MYVVLTPRLSSCRQTLPVKVPRGVALKQYEATIRELRFQLSTGHKDLCPWRDNECPPRFSHVGSSASSSIPTSSSLCYDQLNLYSGPHHLEGLLAKYMRVASAMREDHIQQLRSSLGQGGEGIRHVVQQAGVWMQALLKDVAALHPGGSSSATSSSTSSSSSSIPRTPMKRLQQSVSPSLLSSSSSMERLNPEVALLWTCREMRRAFRKKQRAVIGSEGGSSPLAVPDSPPAGDSSGTAQESLAEYGIELLMLCGWEMKKSAAAPSSVDSGNLRLSCELCEAHISVGGGSMLDGKGKGSPAGLGRASFRTPAKRAAASPSSDVLHPSQRRRIEASSTPASPAPRATPSSVSSTSTPRRLWERTDGLLNPLRSHAPWCPWVVPTTPDPLPPASSIAGLLLRRCLARLGAEGLAFGFQPSTSESPKEGDETTKTVESDEAEHREGKKIEMDLSVLDAATISALLCISKSVFGLHDIAALGPQLLQQIDDAEAETSKGETSQDESMSVGVLLQRPREKTHAAMRLVPGWVACWLTSLYSLLMHKALYATHMGEQVEE